MADITCACCGKDGSGEPLEMHGKCHIDSPTYLTLGPTKNPAQKRMTIYCAECDHIIAPFLVTGEAERLDPECHPGAEVWVRLHKQETQSVITLNCAKCEKEFGKLIFDGYAPKEAI